MADNVTFKLTNEQKVRLAFKLASKQVREALGKDMFIQGSKVAVRAKILLTEKGHVITGNLRRSIMVQPLIDQNGLLEINVGTNVEYAPQIEALPDGGFLLPAFIEQHESIVRGMQAAIDQVLGG